MASICEVGRLALRAVSQHLKQPLGRQCPAERRRVVDSGTIVPLGSLDQKLGGVLPEWSRLMALGSREHQLARLPEGRDLAAILRFDRLGEFSRPGMRERSRFALRSLATSI
jgi:hypothetical protein